MNRTRLIGLTLLSLTLNGLLAFQIVRTAAKPSPLRLSRPTRALAVVPPATPLPHPPPTSLVSASPAAPAFHWSQVESPDYRVYVANLRAIGCPDPTVREILRADLNALFDTRIRDLVDEVHPHYWELRAQPERLSDLVETKQKELRELREERDTLLTELLGAPAGREPSGEPTADQRAQQDHQLAFLSAGQRAAARAILERVNDDCAALWTDPGPRTAEERARLNQREQSLRAEADQELQGLLSAEAYEEYTLRASDAAAVRQQLGELAVTPEEVRALVRIERDRQQARAGLSPDASDLASQRTAVEQRAEAARRDVLGPRYAQYEREQDPAYQQGRRVVRRLNLSEQAAEEAYAAAQTLRQQAAALRADPHLDVTEREARLQALRAQRAPWLTPCLGAEGAALYLAHTPEL